MGAGGGQIMSRTGQARGDPDQPTGGIGEDLQVHPVPLGLTGVVRPVEGDPIDADQCPGQD